MAKLAFVTTRCFKDKTSGKETVKAKVFTAVTILTKICNKGVNNDKTNSPQEYIYYYYYI